MYNKRIIDLFDYESELIDNDAQVIVKIKLAPFFVYIENHFRSSLRTNNISREIIESEKFKSQYKYISGRYTADEIEILLKLLRSCRNIFCHYLVRSKEYGDGFEITQKDLFKGLNFFKDTVCEIDGQLTLQGMLSLMILFMSNAMINDFVNLIAGMNELKLGRAFYKSSKKQGIAPTEYANNTKNELKNRFKNFNVYRLNKSDNGNENFFELSLIVRSIAKFVFGFEKFCYEYWKVEFDSKYSRMSNGLSKTGVISEEVKKMLIGIRNRWAHGNILNDSNPEECGIIPEIIKLFEILQKRFSNNKKASMFLEKEINDFSFKIFSFKYKRLVELAIKISLPEKYDSEKRIRSMSVYRFKKIIFGENEKRLWELRSEPFVTFDFKHKIEAVKRKDLHHVDIYQFKIKRDKKIQNAIINGFKIDEKTIISAKIDGGELPLIQFADKNEKLFGWREERVEDYGFIILHICSVVH